MTQALVKTTDITSLTQLGKLLARSGFFADAKSEAQAVVKVLAGQELGIPPIAAMTGIHVIQGQIAIGANIMAGLVKRHPKYDYKVQQLDNETCILGFYEDGEIVGVSGFHMDDAKQAGILKPGGSWSKYPRNMLFARAVSNGTRLYCPDLLGGGLVYTPDELGLDVDEYGIPVIEGTATLLEDEPEQPQSTEAQIKAAVAQKRQEAEAELDGMLATDGQWQTLMRLYPGCQSHSQFMWIKFGETNGKPNRTPDSLTSEEALRFIAHTAAELEGIG